MTDVTLQAYLSPLFPGANVRETDDECEHYAVIDKRLVWHGGMNLLGKTDVYDNLIRVESEQAAAELLEITEEIATKTL